MAFAGKWEGFSDEDIRFYLREDEKKTEKNVGENIEKEEVLLLDKDHTLETVDDSKQQTTVSQQAELSEKHSLHIFQQRQKLLEEQNRMRKDVLARVLNERRKQTLEESSRLKAIQDELQKVDSALSNDINILRNQIEVAAIEFADAQKRYTRAEKEFFVAKQTLFGKLEKKELLTKHLCMIIEQNEMRKAQKLSELMEKLAVEESAVAQQPSIHSVINSPYYNRQTDDDNDNPCETIDK